MAQPDKEDLYFFIEDYLKTRINSWGLDHNNPANCAIGITINRVNKSRAEEKRAIILDVLTDIYSANTTEQWINLLYKVENYIASQTSEYHHGYGSYINNSQKIVNCLLNIKYDVLRPISERNSAESVILNAARNIQQNELNVYKQRLKENSHSISLFKSNPVHSKLKRLITKTETKLNALNDNKQHMLCLPTFMHGEVEVYPGYGEFTLSEKCPITTKMIDSIAVKQEHNKGLRI